MATNTILTRDEITREAIRILHNKLAFVKKIDRSYDKEFARDGAKIGDSLRVRKPAQFTVRSGKAISAQNYNEEYVTLTLDNQKGVDLSFDSKELTLSLDDFSKRVLAPQIKRLAAEIEKDVFSVINEAGNVITTSADPVWQDTLKVKQRLFQNTAPTDGELSFFVNPAHQVSILNDTKGLFQSADQIKMQYENGILGRTGGFEWYESNLIPALSNGYATSATVDGAVAEGATTISMAGVTSADVINAGTVFTIADVYAINPEIKTSRTDLFQFVALTSATADATGDIDITVAPVYGPTTAKQTVSALPSNGAAISFVGADDGVYDQSVGFHKEAATVAFADLTMPRGTHKAARESYDGISMRYIEDYDISNDVFISRFDVLYGYKLLRPEFICKLAKV
jgi:hypothetical protein